MARLSYNNGDTARTIVRRMKQDILVDALVTIDTIVVGHLCGEVYF